MRDVCEVLEIRRDLGDHWCKRYEREGLVFLHLADYPERDGHLDAAQREELVQYLRDHPADTTDAVRAHIRTSYNRFYSHSGCIKLLHRLGFTYRKPSQTGAIASEQAQADFIAHYEGLQRTLPEDEIIYFGDAVHPDHQVRPAYGWFYAGDDVTTPANTGRSRLNVHGALCLETFDMQVVEPETVNAESTLALFKKLEAANPDKRCIHVVLDNARYHKARMVRDWLEHPGCRIKVHWLPAYAPHLNSIERLWGVMHRHVTHNRYYPTYAKFRAAILDFLGPVLRSQWRNFRDTITDNFRVTSTNGCKVIE